MKIKTLLFSVLLFCSVAAMSQDKGDVRIGAYSQTILVNSNIVQQYGLVGEFFIAENFSLNYKYGMGVNRDGVVTGHINPSLLLLPLFVYDSYELLLATLLISEGVSYHFRVSDFMEIAPYLSPLGAEINLYKDSPFLLSGSTGVNLYISHATPFSKLSIAPSGGIIYLYKNAKVLPAFGLSLNYTFR